MGGPGGARTMSEEEMRDMFGGGGEDPFSDFFRTFFGGGGGPAARAGDAARAPRSQKGRDIESEAELTLEEAYHGAMRRISITLGGHARSIDVRIPPGVKDGSRVRAAGEGEAGLERRRRRATSSCASGSSRIRCSSARGTTST